MKLTCRSLTDELYAEVNERIVWGYDGLTGVSLAPASWTLAPGAVPGSSQEAINFWKKQYVPF